jgi:hypothetical protein
MLQTGAQQHRANNQKRITRVRKYLEAEDTRFQLGLARLCLRLTSLAKSITGQKNRRGDRDSAVDAQAGVRVPLMVRLARGDVSERTARGLTSIRQALRHDATLTPRLGEVVTRLLMTAGQVILRFSQYEGYPARAALMSRAYNSATYYQEVLRFLHVDPKALYSGYCELLRREAWGTAGRSEATLHLLSQPVHEELATIAMAIETSTLDVERNRNLYSAAKLAVISRWQKPREMARRRPNCKERQEVALKQVLEQNTHCV